MNELINALEAERSKVKSYEDLEHHLDEAIVRTGIASAETDNISGNGEWEVKNGWAAGAMRDG